MFQLFSGVLCQIVVKQVYTISSQNLRWRQKQKKEEEEKREYEMWVSANCFDHIKHIGLYNHFSAYLLLVNLVWVKRGLEKKHILMMTPIKIGFCLRLLEISTVVYIFINDEDRVRSNSADILLL